MWAYDFTHFSRARRAALAIIDVVSRKWITTLVCAEESSVQVEVAFTAALAAEDLLDAADTRAIAALRAALLGVEGPSGAKPTPAAAGQSWSALTGFGDDVGVPVDRGAGHPERFGDVSGSRTRSVPLICGFRPRVRTR